MSYSGEMKKLGEWIRRETRVKEVVYNKVSSAMVGGGVSCRVIYMGDEDVEIKRDFKQINLTVRLSGDAGSWEDVLDTVQTIQNNLLREREHDIVFEDTENPDGSEVEGGDFRIDIPLKITVSTGKVAL